MRKNGVKDLQLVNVAGGYMSGQFNIFFHVWKWEKRSINWAKIMSK